jgi:pyridoxine 5-phosphate synthase
MRLAVNIDHVATLREARGGLEPDPVEAAKICESAGAVGIVCHLREDRRHINDRDLYSLRRTIKTKLDLEMAATKEIVEIALDVKPDLVTLVPERRRELTTEGGLDVKKNQNSLRRVVENFHKHKIPVSLFIDPIKGQIEAAAKIGADFIEIHTGEYANARGRKRTNHELQRIRHAATIGKSLGLRVNAGHGLNYTNVSSIRSIETIEEISIGHAIVSRAVFVGLETAVREMVRLVSGDEAVGVQS